MEPDPLNNQKVEKRILKTFREAVKNVPLLKYAWILIATICILCLIKFFQLKIEDVFLSALGVLLICFLGFAFSLFLIKNDPLIKVAKYVIIYILLSLFALAAGRCGYLIIEGKPIIPAQSSSSMLPKDTSKNSLHTVFKENMRITKKPLRIKKNLVPIISEIQQFIVEGKKLQKSLDNTTLRTIKGDTVDNWISKCRRCLMDSLKHEYDRSYAPNKLQKPRIDGMLALLNEE